MSDIKNQPTSDLLIIITLHVYYYLKILLHYDFICNTLSIRTGYGGNSKEQIGEVIVVEEEQKMILNRCERLLHLIVMSVSHDYPTIYLSLTKLP
jgi:hypothetical protein